MHEIFISYRRGDNVARDLKAALDRRFYKDVAFRDVDSPTTGPLTELLEEKIRDARFIVVLISREWMSHATDLTSPNNFVRLEIEEAVWRRKTLIPVFVNPVDKNAFVATFFDPATGRPRPGVPSFIDEINRELFVEYRLDPPREQKATLHDLFAKLEPGLACYWRKLARWRWAGYGLVGLAALTLIGVAVCLVFFISGYAIEQPGPLVVHRTRHPSGTIDLKRREAPPNVQNVATPLKDKHNNWMDGWTQLMDEGVLFKNQFVKNAKPPEEAKSHLNKRLQLSVSKETFGKNYQTFSAAINTKPGYRIDQAFVFLTRNDGPETSYAPVYRQMVANIDRASPYRHNITFTNPNADERIFIIAVIENAEPGDPVVPSDDLLKLEAD